MRRTLGLREFPERKKVFLVEKNVSIFERANSLLEGRIISAVRLQKAGDGKSYVCPKCGNGSNGHKGDGIRQKLYRGRLAWHCYRCGEHMSNSDVIAAAENIHDNAALAKRLGELFPDLKSERQLSFFKEGLKNSMVENSPQKSYAKMYEIQRRALPNFLATVGGTWRGLTNETLKEAPHGGAGYNAKYKSVILPYSDDTYFWREVSGSRRGVNKGGKRRLYVTAPLKVGDGMLNFLTEGEIDALTIKQALAPYLENFGVAATGSINFSQMLIRELNAKYETCVAKPKFIWLGDNEERGINGAKEMVNALMKAGYPAVQIFFADEGAGKVDANQFLQEHGDEGLQKFLLGAVEDTAGELRQRTEEIREWTKQEEITAAKKHGVTICSLSDYFSEGFDAELDSVATYAGRATGFENLDEKQLFLPGVYILGGSPGAGKTTFAWQLLSKLAEGDEYKCRDAEHCVFCSYEMSRLELASKSIARELRRRKLAGSKVLTPSSADVRCGGSRDTDEFKAARAKFLKTAKNLQVAELSNTTLEELLVVLKSEAETAGDKHLTIAIDYLQLIPVDNPKATARERIDEVMLALKTFQRETNATLIVISSLNRESNKYGGNALFSFKESGSIEYSADVTWHLLYEKPEGIETLPRYVELSCNKNRNGATYKVAFDYYAQSDYFCPNTTGKPSDEGEDKDTKKNKHKR